MLSNVAGNTLGVAKRINPVLVRVPRVSILTSTQTGPPVAGGNAPPERYLDAVSAVNDARGTNGTAANAVMLMAWFYPRSQFRDRNGVDQSEGFRYRLWFLISQVVNKGVIPVTGSGNQGAGQDGGVGSPCLLYLRLLMRLIAAFGWMARQLWSCHHS